MTSPSLQSPTDWEQHWAAYDEPTYQSVLAQIQPEDVVLEIGAGDLRLARRLAKRARRVYAIEIQPALIVRARPWHKGEDLRPDNLIVICGDARRLPFPPRTMVAVLLMRHCRHFQLYASKLTTLGCERLITNARWRLGVEIIDLQAPRQPFSEIKIGWYACRCGATGFVTGRPEQLTLVVEKNIQEVTNCPNCNLAGETLCV